VRKSLILKYNSGKITGTIRLPGSKSESNRVLIINALTQGRCELKNLSTANDTVLMEQLLSSSHEELNVEDAGTVMRFLTAYLAITNQSKVLTGTSRMHQRPIGLLVEALRELGADIDYIETEGYPPLRINGIDLSWPATSIAIPGNVSSQYISALLLVSPLLPNGLKLQLASPVFSRPYIDLTLALMTHFGASAGWANECEVTVEPVPYHAAFYTVEADWSAASYWYSLVALAKEAQITLPGLKENTAQGDKKVAELMRHFGVETGYNGIGAVLTKCEPSAISEVIDFKDCPDLAPTIIVLAAGLQREIQVTGLQSLRIKETDRILALQQELAKIGAELIEVQPDLFQLKLVGENQPRTSDLIAVDTYADHRIAMAFAPLALLYPIEINDPIVVRKSYPDFWDDLRSVGITIS
jgi:3-phosphoshikimate 1-carboxyvinyltransferase